MYIGKHHQTSTLDILKASTSNVVRGLLHSEPPGWQYFQVKKILALRCTEYTAVFAPYHDNGLFANILQVWPGAGAPFLR